MHETLAKHSREPQTSLSPATESSLRVDFGDRIAPKPEMRLFTGKMIIIVESGASSTSLVTALFPQVLIPICRDGRVTCGSGSAVPRFRLVPLPYGGQPILGKVGVFFVDIYSLRVVKV